jgi:hypothetical protein
MQMRIWRAKVLTRAETKSLSAEPTAQPMPKLVIAGLHRHVQGCSRVHILSTAVGAAGKQQLRDLAVPSNCGAVQRGQQSGVGGSDRRISRKKQLNDASAPIARRQVERG